MLTDNIGEGDLTGGACPAGQSPAPHAQALWNSQAIFHRASPVK